MLEIRLGLKLSHLNANVVISALTQLLELLFFFRGGVDGLGEVRGVKGS